MAAAEPAMSAASNNMLFFISSYQVIPYCEEISDGELSFLFRGIALYNV